MAETSSNVEAEVRFNSIVDEFGRYLRNAIAHVCPRDLGIEFGDIEQEARLRLWRALQAGTEIRDPASYLYRIAATTTIDAVRRAKARREEQLRLADDESEGKMDALPAGPGSSPDRIAERRLLTRKIREAFGRLPENRRNAVVLYLEGLSSREIASSLGWSESKSRHLTYRGLEELRRYLREEGIEGEID
jgi:RNA polymerase sigma factor (sigma-70 family)